MHYYDCTVDYYAVPNVCTRELVWLLMAGSTQVVYVILIPANVNDMLTRG